MHEQMAQLDDLIERGLGKWMSLSILLVRLCGILFLVLALILLIAGLDNYSSTFLDGRRSMGVQMFQWCFVSTLAGRAFIAISARLGLAWRKMAQGLASDQKRSN